MPLIFARILSVLLHPIFIPLFALFLIFHSDSYLNYNTAEAAKPMLYLFVFLLTVLMPGLSSFILVRNKMVSKITMPHREERFGPYIITLFYYSLLYYLLRRIENLPPVMLSMVFGAMLSLVLLIIFNFRFKISAHLNGFGGLLGIYFALSATSVLLPNHLLIYGLIMLCGLLASARLRLDSHNSIEVYSGLLIGFMSEYWIIKSGFWL